MKKLFLSANVSAILMALSFSAITQAAVTIDKSSINYAEIRIKLTGEEARLLSEIAYEDSSLTGVAHTEKDYSTIRSISCSGGECMIAVEGEINTKDDKQEFYSKDFNRKLDSLKEGEVYLTAPTSGKGFMGESHEYDGKVTRALLENYSYGKSKAKLTRYSLSSIGKKDVGSVSLFKIEKVLGNLTIVCHSTLYTDMGAKNFVNDSCGLQLVAKLEK